MTVRLGVLGCGGVARLAHLPSLARIPGALVVALADTDPACLAAARHAAPTARVVAQYGDVLDMPDVDAVVIALPPALHADAATTAIARGKHVYLEKPITTTLADARRVLAAWRGTGLVGMMGFNYRRNPIVQQARQTIAAGTLGAPGAVRTVFATSPRPTPAWKTTRDAGGGVLLDLGVHHIDLVRFLLDTEVSAVSAELHSLRSEHDTAFLHIRLTSGCMVQSFFSLSVVEEDRIEVFGSEGKLTIDRYRSLRAEVAPAAARGALGTAARRLAAELGALPYALRKVRAPMHDPSFPAALEAFINAVRDRTPVKPDFDDGVRTLEVVEAAESSARSGCVVSLAAPAPASSQPLVDVAGR